MKIVETTENLFLDNKLTFCTAINCIDGRVQLPVIKYLQKYFSVDYVDTITEAVPSLILAKQKNPGLVDSIMKRLRISVEKHYSKGIAIVAHHDCAGGPVPDNEQILHIKEATKFLNQQFKQLETIGLWVDDNWKIKTV